MKFALALALINVFAFINASPIVNNKNPMINEGFFEGDIAGADVSKGVAQIPTAQWIKWVNGIVPYVIDPLVYNSTQINTIIEGMKLIEDQTRINGKDCIKFVPRSTERNYVNIFSGDGCWSYVGQQKQPGAQQVSLKKPTSTSRSSCLFPTIIAHELTHALGFYHEQSRPDRDSYVRILWENIDFNQQHNFNKYTTSVDTQGLPYDYYSIMHYEWDAFSMNGLPTIEALQPGVELRPTWEKSRLTDIDVDQIRKYYNCA